MPNHLKIIETIGGTLTSHGGTSRSVPALCDALEELCVDVHLLVGVQNSTIEGNCFPKNASRVHLVQTGYGHRLLGGSLFAKSLLSLLEPARTVVHDHGIWLGSNHGVASACRSRDIPRIVSPRGMLGSWALNHRKWKKKLAWTLYQRRDLLTASAFHATSPAEAEEIRALGLKQPIAIVPNGITLPKTLLAPRNNPSRQMLFMSRIHPKKGLPLLIQAWKKAAIPLDWVLRIAGPDELNHLGELQQLVQQLGIKNSIQFIGPIDDSQKWAVYAESDLFVLPSYNENFGIVIAEAMAAGLPVITTKGTPWSVLEERKCGWWIELSVDELANTLRTAVNTPFHELRNMGRAARDYVVDAFSWEKSARELNDFYHWVSEPASPRPTFVY